MPRQRHAETPGVSPERVEQAFGALRRWVDDGLTPGVAAVVARHGRVVGELYAGLADGFPPRRVEDRAARADANPTAPASREEPPEAVQPVEAGTLFCLASITKLFTACAATTLVQDGVLALDEPLSSYLGELAEEERGQLTLRRLLTHTSGLPYDLGPEEIERIGSMPTLAAIFSQYSRLQPVAPPGTQVRYSNVNFGLLSIVVERASGQRFGAVLEQRIFGPLGLTQTALPPPPADWGRLARVADTGEPGSSQEPFNSAWWRGLGLPYGGATAPAREVARFMTACLGDRPATGFLTPAMLDLMTQSQTGELSGGVPGFSSWTRADWGLGFELRGDKHLHPFGDLTSPETFGHLGASGTMAWADPESGLVCVVLTNQTFARERGRRMAAFCRFSNAVAGSLLD